MTTGRSKYDYTLNCPKVDSIYVVCNAYPFTSLLFSENIAHLAETALRFLELVQENNLNMEHDLNGEDTEETLHPNENYDSGNFKASSLSNIRSEVEVYHRNMDTECRTQMLPWENYILS